MDWSKDQSRLFEGLMEIQIAIKTSSKTAAIAKNIKRSIAA
jgi:siroheme synthase (precorrin-2 oxidase/ferrochelatase)